MYVCTPIFNQIVNVLDLHFQCQRFELRTLWSLNVIISQTETGQILLLSTNIKLHTAFTLAYLHLTLANSNGQGQGHAHFDCQYFANCDRYGNHCYWRHIRSRMWPFNWHIYIWPWLILKVKFKVMHISTTIISQIVTDKTNIALTNKYKVAYGLFIAYLHLTLVHSKGQS